MICVLWRGIKEDPWSFLLVMSFFGFALLGAIFAVPAHAAVHIDRPAQETVPIASKPTVCTRYVPLMALKTIKEGQVHYYLIVIPRTEPCH